MATEKEENISSAVSGGERQAVSQIPTKLIDDGKSRDDHLDHEEFNTAVVSHSSSHGPSARALDQDHELLQQERSVSRLHLGRENRDLPSRLRLASREGLDHTQHSSRLLNLGREREREEMSEAYHQEFYARPSNVYYRAAAPATVSRPPPDAEDGFSRRQTDVLLQMQEKQTDLFKSLLHDTMKEIREGYSVQRSRSPTPSARSRSKYRSRSYRKRRHSSPSSDSSSCDSNCSSAQSRPKSRRTSRGPPSVHSAQQGQDDAISIRAPTHVDDDSQSKKGESEAVEQNAAALKESTAKKEATTQLKETSTLPNPHQEKKGVVFSNLDWWKDQRTHSLAQEKKDELLEKLKPDASIGEYFKAPDMPKPIRLAMKKGNFEAWKRDNSVWSIQEDMLRTALPLMKAIEKTQDLPNEFQEEIKPLLSSTASLLGHTVHRLSVFRQRHSETFLKEGYLREVTPSMTCIFGDQWTQQVEDEDKLIKVTQKAVKGENSSNNAKTASKQSKEKYFNKHDKRKYGRSHKYNKGHHSHKFSSQKQYNSGVSHNNQESFRSEQKERPQYQSKKYQKK